MPPLREAGSAAKLPINIVVLGAASVGKTALTLQFITDKKVESESCKPTIETSFYKEIKLQNNAGGGDIFDTKEEPCTEKHGVECLWKMYNERERKHSYNASLQKQKGKGSDNNLCETEEEDSRTILKVTDTASYKAVYNPRKSLRERLTLKLTPKRRAPVSSDTPVRRRYLRNVESSSLARNAVPSFIYRKCDGKSNIHDCAISSADAFILVYSVQDRSSFETLQQIRSRIHAVRGCPCAAKDDGSYRRSDEDIKTDRRRSSFARGKMNSCIDLPSIAVVGTHIDLTAPLLSPCSPEMDDSKASSNESLLNYAFTFTPKRREEARKLILQKQLSMAAEVLAQTSKPKAPDVTAERVRGVVGSWSECVGYAEISNNSVPRVRRIFGHLASQVVRSRTCEPSTRKRMDSVLSVFSKKSEKSTSCSCWPF